MSAQALDSTQYRYIELQGVRANESSIYPCNEIITSLYTKYNFLPKALIHQFLNPSKLWFLFITLIELFNLSETTYRFGTLLPLIILLVLHLIREALNDYYRHKLDEKINYKKYLVWNGIEFISFYCKDLCVGDLILLMNNDEVPADTVLLSVGNEEHTCYVDASEIIGESGLKIKIPAKDTQVIIDTVDLEHASTLLNMLNDDLFVALPAKAFKMFQGKMKLSVSPKSTELSMKNLILRGMKIVNTPWLIGVVVYTGVETKVWINNITKPKKIPQLSKITDRWILWSGLILLIISALNTIIYSFKKIDSYKWYDVFLGNLIMLNHMIPISLALSIESVRIFLNYLIHRRDPNIRLNESELCSNLGMVEYIVTDKTGTLTENSLKVAVIVVDNKLYVDNYDSLSSENSQRFDQDSRLNSFEKLFANYSGPIFSFKQLQESLLNEGNHCVVLHFFYCIALCNLAVPEDGEFLAISIDDKVLAQAAADFGFRAIARDEDTCILNVFGEDVVFYVLGTQAFASDRKRSRIVVKQKGSNEVYMYLKGSKRSMENIITDCEDLEDLDSSITEYRSLYLGYRRLTKKEIEDFLFEYSNAKLSLVNKEGRVESVFEVFEKNSDFLGIIGIEDYITDASKTAIKALKHAGIKFWLLSGDSEQSTITSALSSGIIQSSNKILRLVNTISDLECLNYLETYMKSHVFPQFNTDKELEEQVKGNMRVIKSELDLNILPKEDVFKRTNQRRSTMTHKTEKRRSSVHPLISKLSLYKHLTSLQGEYDPRYLNFVLSIDSQTFEFCMETQIHLKYFMFLLFTAKGVCFHGLLPDQKTTVVRLLKHNLRFKPLVMSIGDSISDIGMNQESHISVGIEGTSAARNSDVTVKYFSDIKNLLLIHGHKQYIQISKMVLLSFYAMALLEFQMVFFNIVSGWTASVIFYNKRIVSYKLIASIIPISGLCLLDKDSSSTKITPQAYKAGIFNTLLTVKNLALYILTALIQSIFTFVVIIGFSQSCSINGKPTNFAILDLVLFIILYNTLVLSIFIETYSINVKTIAVYLVSIALGFVINFLLGFTDGDAYGANEMVSDYKTAAIYIVPTLVINTTVIYLFKAMRFQFYPNILEKVRSESPNSSLQNQTRLCQYKKTIHNVFRESVDFNKKKDYDASRLNTKILKFSSNFLEKNYQFDKITENIKHIRIIILSFSLSIAIYSIYEITQQYENTTIVVYLSIGSGLLILVSFMSYMKSFIDFAWGYAIVDFLAIQVFFLIVPIVFSRYSLSMLAILPGLMYLGFSNYWLSMTIMIFLSTIIALFNATLTFLQRYESRSDVIFASVSYAMVYITLCAISSIIGYNIDKNKRLEFLLVQKVQVEIQKTKSVLNYLLPSFVRKRVKEGVRFISENQGIVTIIFCDIENFETILKDYTPQELTILLDDLFGRIDHICMFSGCTKIETVGKTYMACAGLKEPEQELDNYYTSVSHARRCIEMAIAIIRGSESLYLKNGENLRFKIGINSGPVTAGVVGYHKPQFSLVGDTVNTASRMASLCPSANTIQISSETYELIGDTVGLIFHQNVVTAKGKGIMNTYIVSAPIQSSEPGSLTSKHGVSLSQSISELFSYKNSTSRSKTNTRKTTLYKFSNQHGDNERRRSSLISILESEVTVDREFLRRETEILEHTKWFTLSCAETEKEKAFRLEISDTTFPIALSSCLLRILCNMMLMMIWISHLIIKKDYIKIYEFVRLVIETIIVACLSMNLKKHFRKSWFPWLLALAYLLGAVSKIGIDYIEIDITFLDYILHFVQAAHCTQLFFKHFIGLGTLCYIAYVLFAAINQYNTFPEQIISISIFFALLLYSSYYREKNLRYYSDITKAAYRELKKTEELLTHMMPKHVFETLKEQNSVTENIRNVTILYADIVGFTQWSSEQTPGNVVNMLSELFTRFDHLCVDHKVYKVHTIGDCYVAIGYRESENRSIVEECYNMAGFAINLVKIIQEVNMENNIDLNMRIGMHTGDIIGGITGTSIVRYDIYGIDVLIANKMESTSKPGHIKISDATMKILSKHFPDEFLYAQDHESHVNIGGKSISSYFLDVNPQYARNAKINVSY